MLIDHVWLKQMDEVQLIQFADEILDADSLLTDRCYMGIN